MATGMLIAAIAAKAPRSSLLNAQSANMGRFM
jgi:hypothetical protein